MKFLLDTHTFLWFVADDPKIPHEVTALIEDAANDKFFSIASAWEIALKISLGKLILSQPVEEFLPKQLQQNGIELLPITMRHILEVAKLPFHHRDPFDRLLVAQSLTESIPILSADPAFEAYGVRLWPHSKQA